MRDPSNEDENAACYESSRNTLVNKGEPTMSPTNGTVWRDRRRSPLSARALGGLVPAVPIFIPPDQIRRQERFRRDLKPEQEGHPCGSTDTGPLSAELLTRRWVRGKSS